MTIKTKLHVLIFKNDTQMRKIGCNLNLSQTSTFKRRGLQLTFTFHHVKINRIHLHSRVKNCTNLATLTEEGQSIWSGHHSYKDQQFELDLWPRDLKFMREHLLSRNKHCTKERFFRYWGDNIYKNLKFDLDLLPCDLTNQLGTSAFYTETRTLILTFYQLTWKSMRILATFKQRFNGQLILGL